jgi:hypothetical protein
MTTPTDRIPPVLPIRLTAHEAEAQLELIVRQKGEDYKYPHKEKCVYYEPDGAPSCILGHLLHKHGVTRDDLTQHRVNNSAAAGSLFAGSIIAPTDPKEADALRALLSEAQSYQDAGNPWGQALDAGRRRARRILERMGLVR